MATQIGQASILLTADTASFETNMANARDTANGTFGDIRQQAADMQQQFAKGFAVATAAVGALSATVGVLVKDQMELVSALGRTARLPIPPQWKFKNTPLLPRRWALSKTSWAIFLKIRRIK